MWFSLAFVFFQVDEVPYCLARAKEFERLRATILNTAVFERRMGTEDGKFQLNKSWQLVSFLRNLGIICFYPHTNVY